MRRMRIFGNDIGAEVKKREKKNEMHEKAPSAKDRAIFRLLRKRYFY